ncbi:RING-H2 finger protein ATL30-like [Trifolium pratense]|uniref:RING-H2 finger protein ATL30-like n=1 Tax=Trifolium pratense TaxID=57577 RepID=UPI001E693D83|nr:RING-H2 finger protein ATL30-like [Trifolium pratense]
MAPYESHSSHDHDEHPTPTDFLKLNVNIHYLANSNHIGYESFNLPTIMFKKFFSQEGQHYLRKHLSKDPLLTLDVLEPLIIKFISLVQQAYNIDYYYDIIVDHDDELVETQPNVFHLCLNTKICEDDIGDDDELDMEFEEDIKVEEYGICSICMDEFDHIIGTSDIINMPCNHVFHQQCIVEWLQTSRTCPLCRYPMPTTLNS